MTAEVLTLILIWMCPERLEEILKTKHSVSLGCFLFSLFFFPAAPMGFHSPSFAY